MNAPHPTSGLAAIPLATRAARAALQWRLLLLWSACLLIPTLVLALPFWKTLSASFDHSVHAPALARALDLFSVADLLANHGKNVLALNAAGIAAIVLTLLLSPLLSGMVIVAARAPAAPAAAPGFGPLLSGAFVEYGRMARSLVWAVVPLGAALALGGGVLHLAGKYNRKAILESDADLVSYAALAVAALLFMLAHATLDAGRATLAVERRRTSAVKAWWRGLRLLRKRPLATFGVYAALSAGGLLLAALLALARLNLPPVGAAGLCGAFLVTQAIALALAWMRSARLFALIDLVKAQRA